MTGDVIVMTEYDPVIGYPRVIIERADPIARIAEELLDEIRSGVGNPAAEVDGDVLTLRGANRTVIYRIGEYDPLTRSYEIRWPD